MEANYLNARIFQELSVSDAEKNISTIPLIITSTSLAQSQYQDCLTHFKNRLGLKGNQDLYVLINVTMSPWPTTGDFLGTLADKFREVAENQMQAAVRRNFEFPHFHGFVMQGLDQICGVHLPMFNMENHRHQLIISADLPSDVMEKYKQKKTANPTQFFTFGNKNPMKLLELIKDGASFEATVQEGFPWDNKPISDSVTISNVKILLHKSLHSQDLQPIYPDKMTFYAYGRGSELHMDHLLSKSPNIQLNSERIKIVESKSSRPAAEVIAKNGAWLRLTQVNENAMQPLVMAADAPRTSFDQPWFPFKPGSIFAFEGFLTADEALTSKSDPQITGKLALGPSCFADSEMLNADGAVDEDAAPAMTMDALVNGGALAAEYPNAGASPELRNRYQSRVIQSFKDAWTLSKSSEARKRMNRSEQKDADKNIAATPAWIKAWLDDGEKVKTKRGPMPIRMYHSGMH